MAKITINDLMEAGCHFGHQTKRWNPKMKHYVYGAKNGISIIDLTKTMHQIADACNFLQHVVINGGDVLFVGTKRQAREITAALAERTGTPSSSQYPNVQLVRLGGVVALQYTLVRREHSLNA